MLTAVEIYITKDAEFVPVDCTIVFRGTDSAGIPFFTALTEVDVNDIASTVSAELVSNAVTWGITDDIT